VKHIQFGWVMPGGARSESEHATYIDDVERALRLISTHFDTAWMEDHLQSESDRDDVVEGWTALTYFAARNPNLRFGHAVLCQSYRNPALLAKMAATLQYLSGGRYILGLGAGWLESDYQAYNYEFPAGKVRASQLEEALQIIKAMWEHHPVTFKGQYYSITNAYCVPLTDPVPPLMIGAFGPQMLRITARYADWWNIGNVSLEEYRMYAADMAHACHEVGRDPATLKRSCWFDVCACAPTEEAARTLAHYRHGNVVGLVGTPAQLIDQMRQYIELGVDRFEVACSGFPDLSSVKLLIAEVLPSFQV
jgi:alkanesulfonate monooxygenase SsuD/methylene tetrahydromethanopterin reductase-like flavin-dependent oxidoreductase (luciferase family)